jgi:hypothetical protein
MLAYFLAHTSDISSSVLTTGCLTSSGCEGGVSDKSETTFTLYEAVLSLLLRLTRLAI